MTVLKTFDRLLKSLQSRKHEKHNHYLKLIYRNACTILLFGEKLQIQTKRARWTRESFLLWEHMIEQRRAKTSTDASDHYSKGSTTKRAVNSQRGTRVQRYKRVNFKSENLENEFVRQTLCDPSRGWEKGYNTHYCLPIRGRSLVGGMVSATMLRKNVSESKTVTSRTNSSSQERRAQTRFTPRLPSASKACRSPPRRVGHWPTQQRDGV